MQSAIYSHPVPCSREPGQAKRPKMTDVRMSIAFLAPRLDNAHITNATHRGESGENESDHRGTHLHSVFYNFPKPFSGASGPRAAASGRDASQVFGSGAIQLPPITNVQSAHRPAARDFRPAHAPTFSTSSSSSSSSAAVAVAPSVTTATASRRCSRPRVDSVVSGPRRRSLSDSEGSSEDAERLPRKPRAPRPSYSEEQRFFIMFCRIMKDMTWPDIEDGFCDTFGSRSKGGLTSVYYRIRRSWGLEEVLRSGPDSFTHDKEVVDEKAANFSKDFLLSIGYLR